MARRRRVRTPGGHLEQVALGEHLQHGRLVDERESKTASAWLWKGKMCVRSPACTEGQRAMLSAAL
jgi:hypothetical protein